MVKHSSEVTLNSQSTASKDQYISLSKDQCPFLDNSQIVGIDHYNNNGHQWSSYTLVAPNSERWWLTVSADMGREYQCEGMYIWRGITEEDYLAKKMTGSGNLEIVVLMTGTPVCTPEGDSVQDADSRCTLNVYRSPNGKLLSDEIFVGDGKTDKMWFVAEPIIGKVLVHNEL